MSKKKKKIGLYVGWCKKCRACSEFAPDNIVWNEELDRPELVDDMVDEMDVHQLCNFCSEHCIEIEDDEKNV